MSKRIGQWWRDLGLWPRMALGISAGFLLLFAAFFALGESVLRENTERLLNERLGFARMAASHLDGVLRQFVGDLQQAQRLADFDPGDPDLEEERHVLSHVLGQVGAFSQGLLFLDAHGVVVLTYPPNLYPQGTDLSSLPHVAQALQSHAVSISEPFISPKSGQPVAAVTVPLEEEGRFLGLLSGWLDFRGEAIAAALRATARFAQTGHSLLMDREGRVIISTENLPFLSPGEHAGFYRRVLAQGQPEVAVVPIENPDGVARPEGFHVMAVAPLETAPWGVAVGGEVDEIFAGVRRLRLGLAALGGAALLGIWMLTLVGTRLLVKPVQRLTQAAQRIAAGELDTSLEAAEGGEIEALAHALEYMRQQLLEHIRQLDESKTTLERRVLERTEALRSQQVLTRQLFRRAIRAQEEERARISRELHDDTGQTLSALRINLDRLERSLTKGDDESLDHLQRAQRLTEEALAGLRRIIADLRPGVLDQLGLVPALRWVAEYSLQPLGLSVSVETRDLKTRLPEEIETILFRIAQEAMSNVARHSQAKNFRIYIAREGEKVVMRLSDDGRGFNPLAVGLDPEFKHGLGLASMQERASLAGGKVTVESAPRRGTTVHVEVPLPTQEGS